MQSTLSLILKEIESACLLSSFKQKTTLVAVSKTKPIKDILSLYNEGQRDFGENYIDELLEKSAQLPSDIRWHFIGHLQSNKIKSLVKINNLSMIHSMDSLKKLDLLNKELSKVDRSVDVLIQVKTSEENSKSGVDRTELPEIIDFVTKQCGHIRFKGFMTIGAAGDLSAFKELKSVKDEWQGSLKDFELELSMGMSADYAQAIESGSTYVRIGSLLFGERVNSKKENLSQEKVI